MTKGKASLECARMPLDAETRVTADHHESLRVWLRMLACTNLIGNHVRQKLQAQFGTTLPRFDLMAQLERAPEGLKMGELTQRLMVTGGNVTGITDMLEEEGLVLRETDPDDQRAFRVKLTKEGETQFQRMAAAHERWVVGLFEDLTAKQKTHLAELLAAL
jgi:DNA-binding MarR family transcriptional regulator